MGNRHGSEKPAREDKQEKRKKKKEKKAKKKSKKKTAAGSDVDLDPESSHFSRADSESMVFHSAENLSPYLDASTRSEEGAACLGYHDNGHILSSKDFHDGFSIEACLPADLAASGLMSDVTGDVTKAGDDVASTASGGYSTPLLSSPDVRRGLPRSPLAQRQKDSFLEPVPPIPSDFSSNTLSSVSYQEGVPSPGGTDRSSSRASSSTVDTNAAHCIERLEELERNIKRTIIEKFAPYDSSCPSNRGDEESSQDSSPLPRRRRDFEAGERSREGSVTPRGAGPGGAPSQSAENSPAPIRKISEPCRPFQKEGSTTPKGIIQGVWCQSAENSPVIVRKALPNPESPVIMRRTPSQSPTGHRKFPANAPESPVLLRRGADCAASPKLSPNLQRAAGVAGNHESSPRFAHKAPEAVAAAPGVVKPSHKSAVPPPVPPKPCKTLSSPDFARRVQNMPKSPIMPRKVYAFQEQRAKDSGRPAFNQRDDSLDGGRRENQMPPRSPSRSPEVRHRVAARKTPSSSPSPKSLGRKLMPLEDRAPPPAPLASSPPTPIQFCQQAKGIPVKRCIVSTQPSTAVVIAAGTSQESLHSTNGAETKGHAGTVQSSHGKDSKDTASKDTKDPQSQGAQPHDKAWVGGPEAVSEDTIKQNTESAVFGSVSPKLKRQKKISSADESHQKGSLEAERTDRFESSPRSPPCSPPPQRAGSQQSPAPKPSVKINVIQYKGSEPSTVCVSATDKQADDSPRTRRAQYVKQNSSSNSKDEGTLSADIAGGLTYHTHLPSDLTGDDDTCEKPRGAHELKASSGQTPAVCHPLYASIHREQQQEGSQRQPTPTADRKVTEGSTVYNDGPAVRTTHVSQKTLQLAPTTLRSAVPERGKEIPHRAFTAGTTVDRNAAGKTEKAGRETFSHDTARFDERVRACGTGESERSLASGARRVPSPPSLPETVSSSNGTSKAIGRNLGQRIRDVINESTFREVFTAELSSSSLDRDDVTYTSDDSVFAPTSGSQDWNSPPELHGNFRTQAEESLVEKQASGDRLRSAPKTKRAKAAELKACASGEGTREDTTVQTASSVRSDRGRTETELPGVPERNVNFLPDTTAIRRIDVDVRVTLPRSPHQQEETISDRAATAARNHSLNAGSECNQRAAGQVPEIMDSSVDPVPVCSHSSSSPVHGGDRETEGAEAEGSDKRNVDAAPAARGRQAKSQEMKGTPRQPLHAMETTRGSEAQSVSAKEAKSVTEREKGGNKGDVPHSDAAPSASTLPSPAPVSGTASAGVKSEGGGRKEEQREGAAEYKAEGRTCSADSATIVNRTNESLGNTTTALGANNNPAVNDSKSKTVPAEELAQKTERSKTTQAEYAKPADSTRKNAHAEPSARGGNDSQPPNPQESVPPPSPSAMDVLAEEEEEEEEEEDEDGMVDAHLDSDISSRISEEMKLFGETVVKRLSSLLESQASESDSCVEESRSDLLRKQQSKSSKPSADVASDSGSQLARAHEERTAPQPTAQQTPSLSTEHEADGKQAAASESAVGGASRSGGGEDVGQDTPASEAASGARKEDSEPVLHEELNTFCTADLPGERLVTSDTTETLSTDHETSASSKRESTTSTATDETLTSFKTRSTTDSAEFEEEFVLPESLIFVRRVKGEADYDEDGVVVESGKIIKRPPIPAELTKSGEASDSPPHKPRKKRRRQVGSYDVSAKSDATEPVPKRGSKQIRDVIDAYCDEISDESDLSSSTDDIIREGVVQTSTFSRSDHQPPGKPTFSCLEDEVREIVRKPRPPADRSTDSSDESEDLLCQRRSASSQDSSFRIPEIEETFGELMGVKTFLDDLEDKTPTSEPLPAFPDPGSLKPKEFWSASHYRRSRTSPAKTDRTESDLDVSEQRDDASTDSMYADDEDEGTEVVFQRSYSEEHGGEVVLSCTIYNSAHDNEGDSDVYWADPEVAVAAAEEENYKTIETAADAAGSALQNARIQMHDIHQHLQDLRRQMELLQEDITSTSLTLTPDYSLESEQRPLTE